MHTHVMGDGIYGRIAGDEAGETLRYVESEGVSCPPGRAYEDGFCARGGYGLLRTIYMRALAGDRLDHGVSLGNGKGSSVRCKCAAGGLYRNYMVDETQ